MGGHGLGEGRVGRCPVAFEAATPQDVASVAFSPGSDLFDEAGLADARLSGHEHQAALASGGLLEPLRETGQLLRSADQWCLGAEAPDRFFVADLIAGDRGGQALQLELADRREGETRPADEQTGDEVGTEDLAGLGPVAEPLGQHDRGAEEVGHVLEGLAGGEANPDGQALPRHRPARRLLHGNGAGHRVGCGREGDHQSVAQPFHFVAAVLGHRIREELVVSGEDPLGFVVTGAGQ